MGCSEWSNVSSGVPQGTVLGLVLFFLYINDLPTGISSEVRLFADDTVLFRQICCPDNHHRLSDTYLEEVKYYKYLGVYITSSLSWSMQCEEVKTKAIKILCVLQRNLSSCDRAIKREPMLAWSVQLRSTQALLGHHILPKIFLPLSLSNGELPALSLMTTLATVASLLC